MADPIITGVAALVEQAGSPSYEYAERATMTRAYRGRLALCVANALAKGTVGVGTFAGWVVARTTVTQEAPGMGLLTIYWEAGGAGSGTVLPPDEFAVEPFEVNPRIEQHPFFRDMSPASIDLARTAAHGQDDRTRSVAAMAISGKVGDGGGPDDQAKKLLALMNRGVETYYLAGLRYTWTTARWVLPNLTLGGVTQTPGGPLYGYLPNGMGWLRLSDTLAWTGACYRVTRQWLGGPSGYWDAEIYA